MAFNRSSLKVLEERPWRWTTPPVLNPDGSVAVPGVTQILNGVFILLDPDLVDALRANLTQTQKDELATWVYRVSVENPLPNNHVDAALWHVPLWAGETRGFYLRVPAAIWNDPTGTPPAKVKQYLQWLWREAA